MAALARLENGIRDETTGERDQSFSAWHRTALGPNCYMVDIDGLEFRYKNGSILPCVIMEHKAWHVTQTQYVTGAPTRALYQLALMAGVKFWFVWYEVGFLRFRVWDVTRHPEGLVGTEYIKYWQELSDVAFINLIEAL